jgi:hypothetical protein
MRSDAYVLPYIATSAGEVAKMLEPTAASVLELDSDTSQTNASAIHWGAIVAGAVAAAAITLILIAFGAGVGFSAISPWSTTAASTSFHIAAGLYFIVTAMFASSIGGYLAGRLRSKWAGTHTREVFFRDTAHGFLAWGLATLLSAAVLGSATGSLVSGAASGGLNVAGQSPGLLDGYVDSLVRPETGATAGSSAEMIADRGVVGRMFANAFRSNGEFQASDRAYLAQIVHERTGLSQAQAEARVSATIQEAKQTADKARKAAAQFALWLTASLFVGAFSASLAAIEGGGLRDGTWKYKV